jgi:hypothetical protein
MRITEKTSKCPFCCAEMPTDEFKARKPWTCPSCSRQLQLARWYRKTIRWGTVGLTLLFFSILGLRGWRLFIATLVTWFPVLLISIFLLNRIIAPPLEPYGGKSDSRLSSFQR